jgi:hypothetical protein
VTVKDAESYFEDTSVFWQNRLFKKRSPALDFDDPPRFAPSYVKSLLTV